MAGRGDIRAGRAFVELVLKNGLTKGLRAAQQQLRDFGSGAIALGGIMTAAGAGIIAPLAAVVKSFMDTGDALDKMRQRTGISVEALSELGHAADQSGASLEDVEAGVRKMQKALEEADKTTSKTTGKGLSKITESVVKADEAFTKLGLSKDALKKLSPEEQFNSIAKAIGEIQDPTARAAAAMEIFGKSGTKLLPMIEDLDALRAEARRMGFTMSGEAAAAGVKLGDTLANLMKTVKFAGLAVAEVLVPSLQSAAEWIQGVASQGMRWVKENRELVITVAKVGAGLVIAGAAVTALGLSLSATGIVLGGFASAIGVAVKAVGMLRLVMLPLNAVMAISRTVVIALRAAYAVTSATLLAMRSSVVATNLILAAGRAIVVASTAAYTGFRTAIVATAAAYKALRTITLSTAAIMGAMRAGLVATKGALLAIRTSSLLAAAGMAVLSGVGTVIAVLTSPLTLIAGALVAVGVAAFSAIGGLQGIMAAGSSLSSAASGWAQSIMDTAVAAFKELLRIGQQVFAGVKDAIGAGYFALAGRIALAGLKVAFLEGIAAISTSVGGAFGDFLGTLGAQIAGGDFAGAWSTAVAGMSAVWDSFVERITTLFTKGASIIKDVWLDATSFISDSILKLAQKFPKIGKLALGVDMGAEQERADATKAGQIAATQGNLSKAQEALSRAGATGTASLTEGGVQHTKEELQALVENLQRDLETLGSASTDVTAQAQQAARDTLQGQANGIQSMLDELDAKAAALAAASAGVLGAKTVGGATAVSGAAAEAQSELDRLTEEAKRLADERKAKEEADRLVLEGVGGGDMAGGATQKVAGTFSAAAAQAMGQGGGMQQRIAKAAEKTVEKIDDLLEIDKNLLREVRAGAAFTA